MKTVVQGHRQQGLQTVPDLRRKKEGIMYTMNQEGNALVYRWDGEVLSIMPWGENSFRVRSTVLGEVEDTDWALLPQERQS